MNVQPIMNQEDTASPVRLAVHERKNHENIWKF